jgi:hypothetical protein
MIIKDVIKLSATFLGRENVVRYLETEEQTSDLNLLATVDTLTRCANLVINELAVSYVPMLKKERVKAKGGRVFYSDLSERVLEIMGAFDLDGNQIYFKQSPEYIETSYDEYMVEYACLPLNLGINDKTGYDEGRLPARVIAYGVTAEFCFTEHAFDESVLWHNRFTGALSTMLSPKSKIIKPRRFI